MFSTENSEELKKTLGSQKAKIAEIEEKRRLLKQKTDGTKKDEFIL